MFVNRKPMEMDNPDKSDNNKYMLEIRTKYMKHIRTQFLSL